MQLPLRMRDLNENILLHQDIGIGPKLIDCQRRIEYDTLPKEAIKLKVKLETLSEEQRILYVALTRAKEKLIITGLNKDIEKDFKKKVEQLQIYAKKNDAIDYKLIKKYKTYLDWLELVFLNNENNITEIAELYTHTKEELEKQFEKQTIKNEKKINEIINEKIEDNRKTKKIEEALNWEYKYKESIGIPTKTAVTKINLEEKTKVELTEVPKFMEKERKISSAEKGTLMHLCIQRLNEKQIYTKEKIEQMIQDLVLKEIITDTEAKAIDKEKLYQYTKSDLWKNLTKAKEIHKEQPFYINILAKEIYDNVQTEETILVQGIIDLYYISEDNKLILIDYKTDNVKKIEELKNLKQVDKLSHMFNEQDGEMLDYYDLTTERGKRNRKRIQKNEEERNKQKIFELKEITIPDTITVKDLAMEMKKTSGDVIKKLLNYGIMSTINNTIDFDTAYLVASEFGITAKKKEQVKEEDILFDETEDKSMMTYFMKLMIWIAKKNLWK